MAGRMKLPKGGSVHVLQTDGSVVGGYSVFQERADRNGFFDLTDEQGNRQKIHQRRVIQDYDPTKAFVVSIAERSRARCPKCSYFQDVAASSTLNCPNHGKFELQWRNGEKPMTTLEKDLPKDQKQNQKKNRTKRTTASKGKKETNEPVVVDFEKLKNNPSFELWTKIISFDHAKVDARAHVLLINDNSPRKLCFNTYNGTLGKKGKPLPLDEFIKNKEVKGVKDGSKSKTPWYRVDDYEKTVNKLVKSGYEKQ